MNKKGKGGGGIIIALALLGLFLYFFFYLPEAERPDWIQDLSNSFKSNDDIKNNTLINNDGNVTVRGKPLKTVEFECKSNNDCKIYLPDCDDCYCDSGICYQ